MKKRSKSETGKEIAVSTHVAFWVIGNWNCCQESKVPSGEPENLEENGQSEITA